MSKFYYESNEGLNMSKWERNLIVVAIFFALLIFSQTVRAETHPSEMQRPKSTEAIEEMLPLDLEEDPQFDLGKALENNPSNAESHALLGRIYFEKGLYDQSINAFLKASQIDPHYNEIYNKLISLLGTTSKLAKSLPLTENPVSGFGTSPADENMFLDDDTNPEIANFSEIAQELAEASGEDASMEELMQEISPTPSSVPFKNIHVKVSVNNRAKTLVSDKYLYVVTDLLKLVKSTFIKSEGEEEEQAKNRTHLFLIRALIFATVGLVAYTAFSLLPVRKSRTKSRLERMRYPASRQDNLPTSLSQARRKEAHFLRERIYSLGQIILPRSEEARNKMKMELARAGYRRRDAVNFYSGLKVLMALIFMSIFLAAGITIKMKPGLLVLFTPAIAGIGMYFPIIWVRRKAKKRKISMLAGFPDALDLLAVCVDAGLGLNAALSKVSEEISLANRDLSDEFQLVNLEIRAGKPRVEALHNLGQRTDLEDIQSLVAMLIQADKFGTSIAQSLRVHSDASRTKRKLRAEEAAAKTTVKMVFPLLLFILPALFVVVMGPAILQIMQNMGSK